MNGLIDAVELRLCGQDYSVARIIDQFSKFSYTDVFSGKSSFELEISRDADFAGELIPGRIMHMHDLTTEKTRALIIKQVNVSEDTVNIIGNEYAADLFSVRICLYGTQTGTGYDTQTGDVETVMRHYINANILESSDDARHDPIMQLESVNSERGETIIVSARFETLLDVLSSCVSAGGGSVGWEAVVVAADDETCGWYLRWQIVETTDRTQTQTDTNPVVLSEEFGTAKISDYCDTLPETNIVIVGSQGEGALRTQTQIGLSTLTGIMRRESFLDARDTNDAAEIAQRGNERIVDALTTSIEFEYLDNYQCRYGIDFELGDTVTVDAGAYGTYDLPVCSVTTTWGSDTKEISLTVGAQMHDIVKLINDVYRQTPDRRR